jgi:hypothetical protein
MACVALTSLILSTLMMGAIRSSEISVLTRATQHQIPENDILHSRCSENPQNLHGTIQDTSVDILTIQQNPST